MLHKFMTFFDRISNIYVTEYQK